MNKKKKKRADFGALCHVVVVAVAVVVHVGIVAADDVAAVVASIHLRFVFLN